MKKIFYLLLSSILLIVPSRAQKPKFEWVRHFGVQNINDGIQISLDKQGNIYTVGYFQGKVDFDPGAGILSLSANGFDDIYIAKYNPKGELIWAKSAGGSSYDQPSSLVLDKNNNIYFTGIFRETVDFDPGMGIYNLTVPAGDYGAFISKLDSNGNFVWAKQMNSKDMASSYIALDAYGKLYTIGYYRGTVDFDPNAGVSNMSAVGSYDLYVSKLDTNGNFVWAKSFGGTGVSYAKGRGLAIDHSGNIVIGGSFGGTVDFDPNSGVQNLGSKGDFDVFIAKLDPSGNLTWAKQMGGTYADNLFSFCLDESDNIISTGNFKLMADFDPGTAAYNLYTTGNLGIFVSKLDPSGNFVWAKKMSGNSPLAYVNFSTAVCLDKNGSIYTTGTFQYTVDFDPGSDSFNVSTDGYHNVFIEKLSPAGDFVWIKTVTGSSEGCSSGDHGNDIKVDHSGNIYTTGAFTMSKRFNPDDPAYYRDAVNEKDIFLLKMSQEELAGIEEPLQDKALSIYPNPNPGIFSIENGKLKQTMIEVYNLLGKLIYTQNNIAPAGKINISDQPNGIYIIKIFEDGQLTAAEKMVKQ